jgi:hypothetical protein
MPTSLLIKCNIEDEQRVNNRLLPLNQSAELAPMSNRAAASIFGPGLDDGLLRHQLAVLAQITMIGYEFLIPLEVEGFVEFGNASQQRLISMQPRVLGAMGCLNGN